MPPNNGEISMKISLRKTWPFISTRQQTNRNQGNIIIFGGAGKICFGGGGGDWGAVYVANSLMAFRQTASGLFGPQGNDKVTCCWSSRCVNLHFQSRLSRRASWDSPPWWNCLTVSIDHLRGDYTGDEAQWGSAHPHGSAVNETLAWWWLRMPIARHEIWAFISFNSLQQPLGYP